MISLRTSHMARFHSVGHLLVPKCHLFFEKWILFEMPLSWYISVISQYHRYSPCTNPTYCLQNGNDISLYDCVIFFIKSIWRQIIHHYLPVAKYLLIINLSLKFYQFDYLGMSNVLTCASIKSYQMSNYHLRNIGKIWNVSILIQPRVPSSHWWHDALTILKDISVELLMSCYAGSRKSKTMLLEWLVAPKCMIKLQQF